ncbi:hypothetical protein [Lysinibacillus sp. fls2-241-R2A-57]|nr:hypothetical protein [Lysinibacillus sp. fls2-241-R2A-57]
MTHRAPLGKSSEMNANVVLLMFGQTPIEKEEFNVCDYAKTELI